MNSDKVAYVFWPDSNMGHKYPGDIDEAGHEADPYLGSLELILCLLKAFFYRTVFIGTYFMFCISLLKTTLGHRCLITQTKY
jgi:hypothetical protein